MKQSKRILIYIFLGLIGLAAIYKFLPVPIEYSTEPGPYPFLYQDPEHPKAKLLRAKVEPVIEGISNEWEQFIALRKWVKSRWEHGQPSVQTCDALVLLKLAEQGHQFWCTQYTWVYVQSCASLGMPARVVELYANKKDSHSVSEVWSNDYNKWIVMDVDYNCYYTKDGIPLSALGIHNAWLNSETIKIKQGGATTMPDPHAEHENLMTFYKHLFFIFRNDFLILEPGPGFSMVVIRPQWVDKRTKPLNVYSQVTDRVSDIYYVPKKVLDKP